MVVQVLHHLFQAHKFNMLVVEVAAVDLVKVQQVRVDWAVLIHLVMGVQRQIQPIH